MLQQARRKVHNYCASEIVSTSLKRWRFEFYWVSWISRTIQANHLSHCSTQRQPETQEPWFSSFTAHGSVEELPTRHKVQTCNGPPPLTPNLVIRKMYHIFSGNPHHLSPLLSTTKHETFVAGHENRSKRNNFNGIKAQRIGMLLPLVQTKMAHRQRTAPNHSSTEFFDLDMVYICGWVILVGGQVCCIL